LKLYKEEIEKIQHEIQLLSIKKTTYLEFSIENQVNLFSYSYLTYLMTEKEVDGKWVRAFNSYDEFINGEEAITTTASIRASLLILPTELTM